MALPDSGRPPLRVEPDPEDDSRMTLIEHLEQLRRVLLISLIAWGVTSIAAFFFWRPVVDFLIHRGGLSHAYFLAPTDAFVLGIKLALTLGFVAAFPVIVQQVWWFVSPGLYSHERRLALPLIFASVFFFALGVTFAVLSIPLFIKLLTAFAPSDLSYFPLIDSYIGFILLLVIGYGLVFELPVVLYVLGRLRIISSRWLYQHRAAWIIGLGVAANFLTPGADPITPVIMFVPLYIFWEGTALLLKLTGR